MFESLLILELAEHVGSRVEITVDDDLIEGTLLAVSTDFVVVSSTSGYNPDVQVNIVIEFINSIQFIGAA